MTTIQRIIALATAIGTDIKGLTTKQGDLTGLSTTAKSNLVLAINEIFGLVGGNSSIDDVAGDGITNKTWSANKIFDTIEAAKVAIKNELTNGAATALDTLSELATALGNDPNFASTIATGLSQRVRFDSVQTLTVAEKLQACSNIGIGDPDYNFITDYNTAKA
ncbi:hypothetical protein [Flavobacterium laiguense]|uniref:Phage tail protein n=1 Tax=Flavobacterium laiguense TaxID=2169409 RepID=A0A2U1K1E3_9FLAO|nr:hypothetical protein [Flavobacterium laiguense]PWA10989.1 hypothetical protein DB891_03920 [Flavobacterium laiguense]